MEQEDKLGVDDLIKLIKKHKLTPFGLQTAMTQAEKGKSAGRKAGKKAPVKYRASKGNTWAGRGRVPIWLVEAEKAGHSCGEFLVSSRN